MKIQDDLRKFLHDISNDITILEGFLKLSLKEDKSEEEKLSYLEKTLDKVSHLSGRVRSLKRELDRIS